MIRNGIYGGVTKKGKPVARILATVFGILFAILLIFVIWSACTFDDDRQDVFVPQAQEISDLKIVVESQTQTIDELRAEIVQLQEKLDAEKKKNEELTRPEEPQEDADAQTDEE